MKRPLAAFASALALLTVAYVPQAAAQTKIKMVLNWKYQGPQAWYFLAQDRGYFKEEGLDVQIDQGEGSSAPVSKIASGAYDAGFGDINALIDFASKKPAEAPIGVYMMYNTPPFTIVVKKDSPIKSPKDLEGKTLGGPGNDGALKLFPAFAKMANLDQGKISITNMAPNLREQMLMRDQVDAVFGYINTVYFSAKLIGINPEKELRFIKYGDYGMDLYSNTVMVSQKLARENPDAVKGLLRAINRAIKDTLADPEAGLDAVMKREPLGKRDVERERLIATLKEEMSSPEIEKIGLGDVDDARLERAIKTVVQANALPRVPASGEVFSRAFLPPRSERPSKLDIAH